MWPTSDPEPVDWTLVTTEVLSSDQATGSVLLVAQFVDASFGEVTIVQLPFISDKKAEIIGTWDSGISYYDVAKSKWTKM